MKVVNPNDNIHTINLIPRDYLFQSIDLSLYNEATQEVTSVTNAYNVVAGILTIDFEHEFTEDDKYQFKLVDGEEVIYRDKLHATSQNPQDYKLSNGLYG